MSKQRALEICAADNAVSTQLTVQVCLLTYKRPELLRLTLDSLLCLETRLDTSNALGNLLLHILVVDNDVAVSGRVVVEEVASRTVVPIRYVSEPARGLSRARNRALEESRWAEFVAFIDDDETADPKWLIRLVGLALELEADVVTGPVRPRYEDTPTWIKRGGFFSPMQCTTGSEVQFVATNNVLLRSVIAKGFRFDARFDQTGGEDTEYFMRVGRFGHKIVWSQEAVVTEVVPSERATLRWLLSRARSDANRYTRSCLLFDQGHRILILRLLTACGGLLAGIALLPAVVFGRHRAARGLQLIYRSVGTLTALRGSAHIYYRTLHD